MSWHSSRVLTKKKIGNMQEVFYIVYFFYWLLRRSSKKAKQGHKTIFIGQGLGIAAQLVPNLYEAVFKFLNLDHLISFKV